MRQECARLLITEEPDELIAHVRICGGIAPVTGRFYPEPENATVGARKCDVALLKYGGEKKFCGLVWRFGLAPALAV
jgi:hypothetical protein